MAGEFDKLRAALADRYGIEREVGAGGMATVYLAEDLKHHRKVALKVLRPELAGALGPDRFIREIEIAAQLHHPHILALYDSGEAAGFLYYVMPFVEGESLRARLKRDGALSIHETLRILREVADALAYAHQHGVVHRDIKPDNVMLSGRHALVTDFGVAKAVSAAAGQTLTTVGVTLGTPTYMAPEQAVGEASIDHRADIYALGTLAYEMLSGAPPFQRESAQAMLSAQVLERPASLEEKRPGTPPGVSALVMRCLEKKREDRWQTTEELLPMLEGLATPSGGITPTNTRPLHSLQAAGTRKPRRGLLIGAAAAGLVVILALALLFTRGPTGPARIDQIAVLPIQDLSGKDQAFVDAMHDALINTLAQANVIGVIPRSDVMRYRDAGATSRQIAADLHVGALVEGTVYRDGDRVRINMQMVEPNSLRHLWAQTYEREVKDVLSAQKDIVEQITVEVDSALTHPTPSR